MRTLTIKIRIEGDELEQDPILGVYGILSRLSKRIMDNDALPESAKLQDTNGNTVGSVRLEGQE